MTQIKIVIESDNPELLAKVRAGLIDWNERLDLDVDGTGRYYDLTLTAVSDLPAPEDAVVYRSVFDGRQNNRPAVDVLKQAYEKSFEHTTGPIEMHALRYLRAGVLAEFPNAAFVTTDDSDQGPGYVFSEVLDAAGNVLADEIEKVDEELWAPLSDLREDWLQDQGIDPYKIPLHDGPDRSQPVPTPPHFGANCTTCGRRMDSATEPIYPGPEPWTYTCADDAPMRGTTA